jgi:hypothetical protein
MAISGRIYDGQGAKPISIIGIYILINRINPIVVKLAIFT